MISLSWMDDNAATPDASMLGANDVWLVCFDASCNFQGRRSYLSRPEFLDGHGCWHPCAECSGHSSSHEAIAKIRSATGCVGGCKKNIAHRLPTTAKSHDGRHASLSSTYPPPAVHGRGAPEGLRASPNDLHRLRRPQVAGPSSANPRWPPRCALLVLRASPNDLQW